MMIRRSVIGSSVMPRGKRTGSENNRGSHVEAWGHTEEDRPKKVLSGSPQATFQHEFNFQHPVGSSNGAAFRTQQGTQRWHTHFIYAFRRSLLKTD